MDNEEQSEQYEVVSDDGKVFGASTVGGGIMYDNLDSRQMAFDIVYVLNQGIGPDWSAVEAALEQLVVVKALCPTTGSAAAVVEPTRLVCRPRRKRQ